MDRRKHSKERELRELQIEKKLNHNENVMNYDSYRLSIREFVFYSVSAATILYAIGYIFYQSQIVALVLSIGGIYYPKVKQKELVLKRKTELIFQFKQALYSLTQALVAGKAVENAFRDTISDLHLLFPDDNTYIIREFRIITNKIENGEPIEKTLHEFSERANIEDIKNFAEVFATSKRTGGDLVEIIRRTSNIIAEKLEIQQEISVLIAQKRFEAKILIISPFLMIALISYSSPDYMSPLFELGIGNLVMTISLVILVISYWLSNRIMKIRV